MFCKTELKRLWPLGAFFLGYTLLFIVWARLFLYSLPFLLAFFLAGALQPVIAFAQNHLRMSRGTAAGLATVLTVSILLFVLGYLTVLGVKEISLFLLRAAEGGFPEFSPPVQRFFQRIGRFFQSINSLEAGGQKLMDFLKTSADMAASLLSGALKVISSFPTILAMLLVTAFAAFFLARDYPKLRCWFRGLLSEKSIFHLKTAAQNNAGTGRKYLLSYAFLYFLSFCEAFVILSIIRIPYPLLTALATCIADVLPVLGPGFIFVPVAVYQTLTGAYAQAGGILAGWLVMSLIRQIVEPRLVSSTTKVHPLAMLAGVYFSLAAGSIWVLLYTLGLCMLYSIFQGTGALPSLQRTSNETDE